MRNKKQVRKIGYNHLIAGRIGASSDSEVLSSVQECLEREEAQFRAIQEHFGDMVPVTNFSLQPVKYSDEFVENMLSRNSVTAEERGKLYVNETGTYPTVIMDQDYHPRQPHPDIASLARKSLQLVIGKPEWYQSEVREGDLDDTYIRAVGDMVFSHGRDLEGYDRSLLQMVQKRGGVGHFVDLIDNCDEDESFKDCMREFVSRCASYTHTTGQMLDIIGKDNAFFDQDEDGKYKAVIVDPVVPFDIRSIHEQFIDGHPGLNDPIDLSIFLMSLSYIRSLNALAVSLGEQAPFDVRCANFNANEEPVNNMELEDWLQLHGNIQEVIEMWRDELRDSIVQADGDPEEYIEERFEDSFRWPPSAVVDILPSKRKELVKWQSKVS